MTQSFRIDLLVEPFFPYFNIFRIFGHRRAQIQAECSAQVTKGIFRGVAMATRYSVTDLQSTRELGLRRWAGVQC